MIPESWLLDGASNVAILACEDPAETLARKARHHGELTLHWLNFEQPTFPFPMSQITIYREARLAFRFAIAAMALYMQSLGTSHWLDSAIEAEDADALQLRIEGLQDMLTKVEWVRQASGQKYACAFCGAVSERDDGPGHADDCEWMRAVTWTPDRDAP